MLGREKGELHVLFVLTMDCLILGGFRKKQTMVSREVDMFACASELAGSDIFLIVPWFGGSPDILA